MKEPHARFEIKMVVTVINQSIKLIRMDVIVSIHLDSIFELILTFYIATILQGTDANRNWGYHWNEGGSSNDPCSITYHGPEPWSEIENVNVRDFINTIKDKLVFYNSIHSYSQLILLPWGYTYDLPNDYGVMEEVFLHGSDALTAVHGKYYETGCIPCMLYIASGSSMDWAHGDAGIPFTTSMELRDTGIYGFILPPDQIIPTAEETWAFHLTVMREIMTMV